jgi:hypothetical protein
VPIATVCNLLVRWHVAAGVSLVEKKESGMAFAQILLLRSMAHQKVNR